MSERCNPSFYREHAARLSALAGEVEDPALRLQFRDIAKSLTLLADFAVVTQSAASRTDAA
ncbi:MAG TPA: hypothetical protein VGF92_23260 [Stellaceae bacterium]|jgi:hypothetical protein